MTKKELIDAAEVWTVKKYESDIPARTSSVSDLPLYLIAGKNGYFAGISIVARLHPTDATTDLTPVYALLGKEFTIRNNVVGQVMKLTIVLALPNEAAANEQVDLLNTRGVSSNTSFIIGYVDGNQDFHPINSKL
jgi:hypothetical protein